MYGRESSSYWTAQLALRGISRARAAAALHLSVSALNKRLRGEMPLREDDIKKLDKIFKEETGQ